MNSLFLLTSTFFFIWSLRNLLFWVGLWQLKEYRPDRIKIHLLETDQGKKLLLSKFSLIKWIILLGYGITIFQDDIVYLYQLIIAGVFFVQFIFVVKEIWLHLIKRPTFSIKALFILAISFLSIYILYLFPVVDKFLWLLVLDRLLVMVVFSFIVFTSFPTELYRDWKIERAIKKIRRHKNVLIIAVTGSYGKSSTKEYIAQILGRKFRVIKTKGTNNTPIGLAQTILTQLNEHTQIFVAEMGAYKIGEITQLCQIARPHISVLTAVNYQHMSLFGSIENTMKAKYEIMEALPRYGLGLFNGNNDRVYNLYEKTIYAENNPHKRVSLAYGIVEEKSTKQKHFNIIATQIKVKKDSIVFDVILKFPYEEKTKRITNIEAPVIGIHSLENILPGIFLGSYLGMSNNEVKETLASLTGMPKTMTLIPTELYGMFVDDTFNANPEAVLAALSYAKLYKAEKGTGGKKILVLQPMIELGKNAGEEHYRIAKEISIVCDYLLLTNKNYLSKIQRGILDGGGKCEIKTSDQNSLAEFILKKSRKNDIVIFEGKESNFVLTRLLAKFKNK